MPEPAESRMTITATGAPPSTALEIQVRLPLNPARWVERACRLVGRDFTQAEWDEYVPGGGAVQSACA